MKAVQIAASANLNAATSVHSATFKNAVGLAVDWLRERQCADIDLIWVNDSATPAGGLQAAEQILRSGAQFIVGHYASGAALAAAPLYSAAGRALLLPAASAERLTDYSGVYRLCDSDRDYAEWISEQLAVLGISRLWVGSDGSAHAQSVRRGLEQILPGGRMAGSMHEADALLFSGMFEASLDFAQERIKRGDRRCLLLTDDAQSDRLAQALGDARDAILIMGFRTAPMTKSARAMAELHRQRWGKPPGIYFFETVAAFEVAAAWLERGDRSSPVETVLGPIAFDSRGESRPRRFGCFRPTAEGLVEFAHRRFADV
jgi:ABC-type branched-subunit amino acid transport system substrate-binding protein